MSCWYDLMPDKMNLGKLLYHEFQKTEVMTMSVVGGRPKEHADPSCKATKHIECTFLISDYFYSLMFQQVSFLLVPLQMNSIIVYLHVHSYKMQHDKDFRGKDTSFFLKLNDIL